MSNESPLDPIESDSTENISRDSNSSATEVPSKKLNARQELFVQEYLKDYNATQAAIRAGYSKDAAGPIGCRLLKDANISLRVESAKEEKINRVKIEQDDVLRELLIVMKSDVDDFRVDENNRLVPREGISPQSTKAISGVRHKRTRGKDGFESEEIEYKLWDKTRAIEMGMKHLGLMFDRLKIEDADEVLAKVLGVEKEKLPE
jgi:phage terminase small subunit